MRITKSTFRVVLLIFLAVLLELGSAGCSLTRQYIPDVKSILEPEPFVQHSGVKTAVIGGDFLIVVSALIFNAQPDHPGNVNVTAEIWTQGNHWRKSKVIYLEVSEIVETIFKEPTILGSGMLDGKIEHRVTVSVKR